MIFASKTKRAFSLIEVLVVLVLISAGILPVYSLIYSGQTRIMRADARTMATLYGSSALELARTMGYDKAQKLQKDEEFLELQSNADKNGFELTVESNLQPITPLPEGAKPMYLLRVKVQVKAKYKKDGKEMPALIFVTLLTDPRYSYY